MKTALSAVLLFVVVCIAFAQPYEPSVIWDRSGETDSSAYGYKILPLGDQNGDGLSDWAVYAQGNGGGWHGTRPSSLEFFYGGENPSTQPYFVFREDSTVYHSLWYADGVGDLNGDSYQDWMTSFWLLSSPPTSTEGIFWGGHGSSNIPDMEWTIAPGVGLYPFGNFNGDSHGDFNGDGFDDLYEYDFNENIARAYYGGDPMDTLADWVISQPPPGINQTIPYAVGDFNGDGASDFLCFNPNNYNVAIFLGGANADTVPAYSWTLPGQWPIGGVKSLNGDAPDEMVFRGTNDDYLYVYSGNPDLTPVWNYQLNFSCQGAASVAVSGGDFNHDGYNDLIMLTDYCPAEWFGSVNLHLGHPWLNPDPALVINGDAEPLHLMGIWTAVGLGDVNGDGVDDIAIGAWDDLAYLGWRGRCIIVAGDDSLEVSADEPPVELPHRLEVEAYPNPFNSDATIRLKAPPSHLPVTLCIFNLLGQIVRQAALPQFTGEYDYHLTTGDLPSGLYLAQAKSGDLQATQKLMLLK